MPRPKSSKQNDSTYKWFLGTSQPASLRGFKIGDRVYYRVGHEGVHQAYWGAFAGRVKAIRKRGDYISMAIEDEKGEIKYARPDMLRKG